MYSSLYSTVHSLLLSPTHSLVISPSVYLSFLQILSLFLRSFSLSLSLSLSISPSSSSSPHLQYSVQSNTSPKYSAVRNTTYSSTPAAKLSHSQAHVARLSRLHAPACHACHHDPEPPHQRLTDKTLRDKGQPQTCRTSNLPALVPWCCATGTCYYWDVSPASISYSTTNTLSSPPSI